MQRFSHPLGTVYRATSHILEKAVKAGTGAVPPLDQRHDGVTPHGLLAAREEFAPYLASIPRSGLTSVSFTDWKANFEGLYQMATSLVAFLPVDGEIPIDLSLLPDVGTLTKHLFGAVSWSGSDGNGWSSQTISPWGPEMVGVLAGVGVAGAAAVFMVMEGDSSGF